MDTNSVIDFLKCSTCKELYKHPKSLPCGHNLCRKCLQLHINRTVPVTGRTIFDFKETSEVKPAKETFQCPVDECGKAIRPAEICRDIHQWAYQFQTNLELVTIIEICSGESGSLTQYCSNCIKMRQKKSANVVCFSCLQKFCINCEILHRLTRPGDKMYNILLAQSCLVPLQSNSEKAEEQKTYDTGMVTFHTDQCKLHIFSKKDLFCEDCEELICSQCKKNKHGHCTKVTSLGDLNRYVQQNGKQTELAKRLHSLSEKISEATKNDLEIFEKLNERDSKNEVVKRMSGEIKLRLVLWEMLHEHVQTLRMQLEISKPFPLFLKFSQMQRACAELEQEIENYSKEERNMEDVMKAIDKDIQEENQAKMKLQTVVPSSYAGFQGMRDLLEFPFYAGYGQRDDVTDLTGQVAMVESFDMHCADDREACWITSCTFMDNDYVIAADNANQCLKWKMRDSEPQKLTLPSKPWCLDVDCARTGCVTLPQGEAIQFFDINSSSQIIFTDLLKLNEQCYGVVLLEHYIVISVISRDQASVKVLLKDGTNIQTISCSENIPHEELFREPKYLAAKILDSGIALYVSDFRLCSVTCISFTRDFSRCLSTETLSYKAEYPTGIGVDTEGHVLVCGNSGGDLHQIIHSSEFNLRLLAKRLALPRSVSCQRDSKRFTVSLDSGPRKNHLLVFEVRSPTCSSS